MIKRLVHYFIRRFESSYNYDASYLHTINDISPNAVRKLMRISGMTGYQGPVPAVWGGAALASTLHNDCGPCAQLVLTMVQEAGLDRDQLRASLRQEWSEAGATGLGFQFAHAVLNNDKNIESLREKIIAQHGEDALISAAFATASYPIYPLLKRSLGSTTTCDILRFDDDSAVSVRRHV